VAHISVADPFCPDLSALLTAAAREAAAETTVHQGGTFVIIEGPRFSTRGESQVYRSWGCSLIGMTTCPEAFLAREAEISYATIAHITDYDVWHQSEAPVTVAIVIQTMTRNIAHVQAAIALAVERIDPAADYPAHHALQDALTTQPAAISPEARQRLALLVGRYLG
jgi:5'-methylthioadenosine phosphorylase